MTPIYRFTANLNQTSKPYHEPGCPIHGNIFIVDMGGKPRTSQEGARMTSTLWTHLSKDLRIEWRSKDAINSMLFFAFLVVVLFSMSFDPRGAFAQQIAGGVLSVATMFASVSALNQAWAREIRHQVMDAQRMAPSSGAELFLAKVLANFIFVSIVQIALAPVFLVMYNLHAAGQCMAAHAGPCRWALGRWSPTEPSSPLSPSAAAIANCCCR